MKRKVHTGKHLSDNFPIQNGLKQRDALPSLLFNFTLEYDIRKVQETKVGLKSAIRLSWQYASTGR
jgi:hypothetical protein